MPIFLRKSKSLGPLRLNLSKSGLGASVGVKGARLAIGPRGTQVNLGRKGIYYRKSLNRPVSGAPDAELSDVSQPVSEPQEVRTAEVDELVDTLSEEVLSEINAPRGNWFLRLLGLSKPLLMQYQFDDEVGKVFQAMQEATKVLSECQRLWLIEAEQRTDQKHHAGASTLITRRAIQAGIIKPPRIETNVEIWGIDTGRQKVLFFPDRLLLCERGKYGAVSYPELKCTASQTQFREGEALPSDGQVVGQAWQYVNKSGGPDHRFKNNRQVPILLYGQIELRSDTGLNLILQTSNKAAAEAFCRAMTAAINAIQLAHLRKG